MTSFAIVSSTTCVLQLVVAWGNRCNIASGFFAAFSPHAWTAHVGTLPMTDDPRSGCAINLTLEVIGDKWSLLVIRDMIFGNRRHFRELLTHSQEGISSNILADRLKTLLDRGIITWADDPSHKQKGIYSLTEQGIELLPILAQMSGWGFKYLLSEGGPKMWEEFMDELRETHLGVVRRKKKGPSVGERLQAAYQRVMARKGKK
jgi:DNA-binding HxlR family transcriptional regulator